MRKMAALCIASFLLASCVGIDSRLTIREDGSGSLSLSYRVSQLVAALGLSTTGSPAVPLPLTRADFDRSVEASGDKVRVTSFDRTEDEKDITIKVQLAFETFDALARLDAFRGAELKLATDGSRTTFTQLIARAPSEPINGESMNMIDALFGDYDLGFVVTAPRPIQAAPLGTLSADKRTLSYRASVKDVVSTATDLMLSAAW